MIKCSSHHDLSKHLRKKHTHAQRHTDGVQSVSQRTMAKAQSGTTHLSGFVNK